MVYNAYITSHINKGDSGIGYIIFKDKLFERAESNFCLNVADKETSFLMGLLKCCNTLFKIMDKEYDSEGNCIINDSCNILIDEDLGLFSKINYFWIKSYAKNWEDLKTNSFLLNFVWRKLPPFCSHPSFKFIKFNKRKTNKNLLKWIKWSDKNAQKAAKKRKDTIVLTEQKQEIHVVLDKKDREGLENIEKRFTPIFLETINDIKE